MTVFFFFLLTLAPQQPKQDPKPNDDIVIKTTDVFRSAGKGRIVYTNVSISREGQFLITADHMTHDSESEVVEASGNIKIDYQTELGLIEVTARETTFYLDGSAAIFTETTAQFGNEFFFVGERVEMHEGGEEFLIENGTITTCNQATAQWSFKIQSAKIKKEGYALVKGARFRIKDVPVLYIPWMIVPAMQKRRSGLLMPITGSSERNGSFFSQPIYWAPRGDFDMTFTPSFYEKVGLKMDLEARYATRPDLSGRLEGSLFNDKVIEDLAKAGNVPVEDGKPLNPNRFRVNMQHNQTWKKGNIHIKVEAGSDFSVDRDYLQNAQSTRLRDYYYRLGYDRNIGRNALYLRMNRLERILATKEAESGKEITRVNQVPELRFYMPNMHLGSGFFLRNYFYGDFFDYDHLVTSPEKEALSGDVLRIGIDSELSRAQDWSRFLRTRWGARYQGAYYRGDDVTGNEAHGGGFGFLETTGPRFSRTYGTGQKRIVHYLDAAITVKAGSRKEEPFLESIFLDELDIRLNEQVDGIQTAWKVNSRMFAGPRGRVRPYLDMEISQEANLDSDQENRPIKTRFRLLNLGGFHAQGIFDYNPDRGTLDTLSVYGSVNRNDWRGYGGYVRRGQGLANQESFIGILQFNLSQLRSRFKVALDYNFETNGFKTQEFLYGYRGQCVGVNLNYVKSPFDSGVQGNRDFFRITLTLGDRINLGSRF